MSQISKIAAVQMDIRLGDPTGNLDAIMARLAMAIDQGAQLIVFPECALSGYCYESREEAWQAARPMDCSELSTITQCCRDSNVAVVLGLLEQDEDRLFNSLAFLGPEGPIGIYRKVHLPCLGVDKFVDRGDLSFNVFESMGLRVGMQICYDGSFPEPTRVMALQGADIVLLPTNWPPGAGCTADYVPNCRALENHVYFVAANRVGDERGFHFVGKSKICEPNGSDLVFADHDREQILFADIDPKIARNKHLVRVPGKHEIDRFADRQPADYGAIVATDLVPERQT